MKNSAFYNILNSLENSKKKNENHKKKYSFCKIDVIKNENYDKKNKLSPENKSFIFSDYSNSGVTLDQSKINSEKNVKIKKNEKLNFYFLNSKEHKNYMKNFIENINRSISKNKKKTKQKYINKNKIEENNKNDFKINIKQIFQNVQKYSIKEKSISEQIMNNVKKIKSVVINKEMNLDKNSNSNHSSTLISHSSIFNSKPSNSIVSSISISKKESNNNSEIASNLDEVVLTYSEEKSNRNKIYDNNIIKYDCNKNEDFENFCEKLNKKLFGN